MSKPESGLFHGTSGSHASSFDKKKQALETVRRLIAETPGGRKKSMAAGAYDLKTGKMLPHLQAKFPNASIPSSERELKK
jgi:hypothetical protein